MFFITLVKEYILSDAKQKDQFVRRGCRVHLLTFVCYESRVLRESMKFFVKLLKLNGEVEYFMRELSIVCHL